MLPEEVIQNSNHVLYGAIILFTVVLQVVSVLFLARLSRDVLETITEDFHEFDGLERDLN